MWAMRWLVPVITALSVSGCDNFKDCGGFWDKTFGSESCEYKRQLVQISVNNASPTQTSIEAAFQAGVTSEPVSGICPVIFSVLKTAFISGWLVCTIQKPSPLSIMVAW